MTFGEWQMTHGYLRAATLDACRLAWDAATAAERERCAKVVPTTYLDALFVGAPKTLDCRTIEWMCKKIAAAIRATPDPAAAPAAGGRRP